MLQKLVIEKCLGLPNTPNAVLCMLQRKGEVQVHVVSCEVVAGRDQGRWHICNMAPGEVQSSLKRQEAALPAFAPLLIWVKLLLAPLPCRMPN